MLLKEMTEELKANFPNLQFSINEKGKHITIPAKSVEVGNITIYDDSHELTIGVGNFTHWHASCYEDSLNEKEKRNLIVSEVIEFLTDLFNEKIVMWGNNESGGGFYNIEGNLNEQDAPLEPEKEEKYVWSGKIIS
jgi:hypothetical protein